MNGRDKKAYLLLETLFPSCVSPTRLQIISKNLSRVLLNHNARDGSNGLGGTGSGVCGVFCPVGVLNLDGGVIRLELCIAGSGGRITESGGSEGAHGGVVVVVVLVIVDDCILGVVVWVGVDASGGDTLQVVIGCEGAVAGVGGEGGGREGRHVLLGHALALVDGGCGGSWGGVGRRRGLGTAGTKRSSAVRLHVRVCSFLRNLTIGICSKGLIDCVWAAVPKFLLCLCQVGFLVGW